MIDPVLLVDDEELVRFGLRTVLEAAGDFEVVGEAGDGAAGVRAARELRPDVVLMDIRMPVMDGLAATEADPRAAATRRRSPSSRPSTSTSTSTRRWPPARPASCSRTPRRGRSPPPSGRSPTAPPPCRRR